MVTRSAARNLVQAHTPPQETSPEPAEGESAPLHPDADEDWDRRSAPSSLEYEDNAPAGSVEVPMDESLANAEGEEDRPAEDGMDVDMGDADMGDAEGISEMDVEGTVTRDMDGEEWLFTPEALAEFERMRANARLRDENMDEEMSEFDEEKEFGDLVADADVAEGSGPSQDDDDVPPPSSQPVVGPSNVVHRSRGGRCKFFPFLTNLSLIKLFYSFLGLFPFIE